MSSGDIVVCSAGVLMSSDVDVFSVGVFMSICETDCSGSAFMSTGEADFSSIVEMLTTCPGLENVSLFSNCSENVVLEYAVGWIVSDNVEKHKLVSK